MDPYPGGKTPLLSHLNLRVFSKTLQILAVSRVGEGKADFVTVEIGDVLGEIDYDDAMWPEGLEPKLCW